MTITVIATSTKGTHNIPLSNVVAFYAVDKYVEVHTVSGRDFFLAKMQDDARQPIAPCICPHCKKAVTASNIPGFSTLMSMDSLQDIEKFMQGRTLPLLRIHRNCIINVQHIVEKEIDGARRNLITVIGAYAVSRRYHTIINRGTRVDWYKPKKQVAA